MNEVEHRIAQGRIAEELEAIRREYGLAECIGDRPKDLFVATDILEAATRGLDRLSGAQTNRQTPWRLTPRGRHLARRALLRAAAAALALLIDLGPEEGSGHAGSRAI